MVRGTPILSIFLKKLIMLIFVRERYKKINLIHMNLSIFVLISYFLFLLYIFAILEKIHFMRQKKSVIILRIRMEKGEC